MSENTMSEVRQRNTRASELQKLELIKYFEDNPEAIRIVNGAAGDAKTKQRIWIEIAHRLNLMEGTLKSTSKWAKYWNDIIIYTRSRAKSIINGNSKNDRAPTSMDTKILSITGQEYLLKKWMSCLKENNTTSTQLDNGTNSDISVYEEEDEVLQVSSSEQQYEPCHENSQPETKVNITDERTGTNEHQTRTHRRSNSTLKHDSSENEFSSNEDGENYIPNPRKKPKIEPNQDGYSNGDTPASVNSNVLHEFRDLFKEIPSALNNLANGFVALSQAINNVATVLERRN